MANDAPYVGPRPFEAKDRRLFFGRDREASELLSMIFAHPILLLYAQSGAGKTSLLNAKLIPMLQEEEFDVFPVSRIRVAVPEGLGLTQATNPYAFCTMLNWAAEFDEAPESLLPMTLAGFNQAHPHSIGDLDEPLPRVLIFDQFEELFTACPEHWEHREAFVRQIAGVVDADPLARVLLVIREDFVAQLDPFAPLLPERLQARYRMERLKRPAAKLAIEGPLANTERRYDEGVADMLSAELTRSRVLDAEGRVIDVGGQYVEPVQLQVVCSSIWANLPPGTEVITEEHLRTFGNVDTALQDYYERVVRETTRRTLVNQKRLRGWIEETLITGIGTRNTVYRGPQTTGDMPNAVIDALEDEHLIRAERRAGARWYELTHDSLIEPIRTSNRQFNEARMQRLIRRLLVAAGAVAIFFVGLLAVILIAEVGGGDDRRTEATVTQEYIDIQTQAAATARAAAVEAELARAAQDAMVQNDTDLALALAMAGVEFTGDPSQAMQQTLAGAALVPGTRRRLFYDAQILSAAASPDGETLVFGTGEGEIVFWDMTTWAMVKSFEDHTAGVTGIAFSPDGSIVASGARDNTVRVWNFDGLVYTFETHQAPVNSIAFSPNGQHLASGALDSTLALYDVTTGETIAQSPRLAAPVYSAAFSPDGTYILAGLGNGDIMRWNPGTDTVEPAFAWHTGVVQAIAFAHDGALVLSGSNNGDLRLWNPNTGQQEGYQFDSQGAGVTDVVFSAYDDFAFTGLDNGALIWWDARTRDEIHRFTGHTDAITAIASNDSSHRVITASRDQSLRQWDLFVTPPVREFTGHTDAVYDIALSPDETRLLSASADATARLWDASTGETIHTLAGHSAPVTSVAFSPDGAQALTGSADESLILWDLANGEEIRRLAGHRGAVWDVAFAPDGDSALSASEDNTLIWWDVETGKVRDQFFGHDGPVYTVVFSPDGDTAISGGEDGLIVWYMADGLQDFQQLPTLVPVKSIAAGAANSPWSEYYLFSQSRTLYLSSYTAAVEQYSDTGRPIGQGLHIGEIRSITRPDARGDFFSGGLGGIIYRWNLDQLIDPQGQDPGAFLAIDAGSPVYSVALSADSARLFSGTEDGVVRLWEPNPALDTLVDWVWNNRYVRPLTQDEQFEYLSIQSPDTYSRRALPAPTTTATGEDK